jgi:hypothetical protein
MRFEYTLSLKDYKAALILHSKQSVSARLTHLAIFWLPTTIGTAIGICLMSGLTHFRLFYAHPWLTLLFWSAFVCILAPIQYKSSISKKFEKLLPTEKRSNWTSIDDSGVTSAIVGTEESNFLWSEIAAFAQNKEITMLYLDQERFLFFPTSVFTQPQLMEFRELAARNMRTAQC